METVKDHPNFYVYEEPLNDSNPDESNPKPDYLKNTDPELASKLRASLSLVSPPDKLSWRIKIFYSVGHIYNDITGALWLAFTLLNFKFQFNNTLVGILILIGQAADAIASPLFGHQIDKVRDCWIFKTYGRKKTWHLLGVITNTMSIPLIYNKCFGCTNSPEWVRFLYFTTFAIIFQAGWAATQVAHVSLITDLTNDSTERLTLNAYRQAATIAANICVYSITLFVLGFGDDKTISIDDLASFTKVSYIVCGIGLVFSALFHIFVTEPSDKPKPRRVRPSVFALERKNFAIQSHGSSATLQFLAQSTDDNVTSVTSSASSSRRSSSVIHIQVSEHNDLKQKLKERANQRKSSQWLKSFSFWKITTMYTMARVFVNASQMYIPLYLQYTLRLPKRTIAIIPFSTYIAGLVCSFSAKPISAKFGSRYVLIFGTIFGILSSVWIYFGGTHSEAFRSWQIYGVAAFLGIGGTALIISSLALTSDLIGTNTATGAFVFAAMSFFDKSINGIVVALFEKFNPKSDLMDQITTVNSTMKPEVTDQTPQLAEPVLYYWYIMISVTSVSSIIVILCLLSIIKTRYGIKTQKGMPLNISVH